MSFLKHFDGKRNEVYLKTICQDLGKDREKRITSLTRISKLSYSHHVCSSLPLQQQHCWLYHRGILQSGLYVLIAFFERLWTSPLSIMSSFKEMGFDMTEQRECEGHGEHRIPNVFLSFLILNRQKFEMFNVYWITPTFLLWRNQRALRENVLFYATLLANDG